MSRKHFVKIAADIRALVDEAKTPEARDMLVKTAERLCDTFAECNDRFDRRRFLTACGM